MNSDLEKLIDMSIIDGIMPEKKKEFLIRKANEMGVDLDELDIYIDSLVYKKQQELKQSQLVPQLKSNPQSSQKTKVGNIRICPSCGAEVKALHLTCDECGHEFTNISTNESLKQLEEKLQQEDIDPVEIIENHPIPNDKESLFDTLIFMSGKVLASDKIRGNWDDWEDLVFAYQGRSLEIINKLRIISPNDSKLMTRLDNIENKMEQKIKSKSKKIKRKKIFEGGKEFGSKLFKIIIFISFFFGIYLIYTNFGFFATLGFIVLFIVCFLFFIFIFF